MANKKSIAERRQQLADRAAYLMEHVTIGTHVDRCYRMRNMLIAEFGITTSYAQRLTQAAERKTK